MADQPATNSLPEAVQQQSRTRGRRGASTARKRGYLHTHADLITTLYFEWNPVLEHPRRRELFLTAARPTLQHLILRECKIGNALLRELLKKLRDSADCRIKSLDLYANDLTAEAGTDICQFVEENKSVEFLGLSKNALGSDDVLKGLFSSIGEVPLTEEEYEQHRAREKARD